MDLKNKTVLVAGTGISGIGAVGLLAELGSTILLYEGNISRREEDIRKKLASDNGVSIIIGILKDEVLSGVDLCVMSPGIPLDAPFLKQIEEKKIPVWSELELAYRCSKGRLAAITGTNGKTTTTSLVGQIVQDYYKSVFVVGNIGMPYSSIALRTTEESITVAEVSSFQLETIKDFRPDVCAILNITPDHLNRHGTLENYIKIKKAITKNQKEEDCCILNYDDLVLRDFGNHIKSEVLYFSRLHKLDKGVWMEGNTIFYSSGEEKITVCNTKELLLIGSHNYENVMAAVAIAVKLGIPMDSVRMTVKRFKSVEHRIEYVAEKNHVIFYNDSKGTNPDAAIKAVEAMTRPTLLIAGGYDKDSDYRDWIKSFSGKVRYLVLIGQTRDKIAAAAREAGFQDIIYAENMEEAVQVCYAYANPKDAVLLSPACASWGMFDNYEQRGNVFKACVNNL